MLDFLISYQKMVKTPLLLAFAFLSSSACSTIIPIRKQPQVPPAIRDLPDPVPTPSPSPSILGTHQVVQIGKQKPKDSILVTIDKDQLSFKGCNNNFANYGYRNGKFNVKEFGSTRMACEIDQDREVADGFKKATKISLQNGYLIWKNAQGNQTLKTKSKSKILVQTSIQPPVPVSTTLKPPQSFVSLTGQYTLSRIFSKKPISPLSATIKGNQIFLQGCNKLSSNFKHSGQKWTLIRDFISTKMACKNDQDGQVTGALKKAVRVGKKNGELAFFGEDGEDLISFRDVDKDQNKSVNDENDEKEITFEKNQSGRLAIEGRYQIISIGPKKLQKPIILTIDKKTVGFKGCNHVSSAYRYIPSTQKWTVNKNFISTMMACFEDDHDSQITQALLNAVKAQRKRDQLIFQNSDGKMVLVLVEQRQKQQKPQFPSIEPKIEKTKEQKNKDIQTGSINI